MTQAEKQTLLKYYPNLTDKQIEQFALLPNLYKEWNSMINVISRKDIENLFTNHILHSLTIGLYVGFKEGTRIFDIGTGGGFPGIPLAILFPECEFLLIDSIGKKIKVAQDIATKVGLSNVRAMQVRAEELKGEKCHFIVSRAAMDSMELVKLGNMLVDKKDQFNGLPNGIIALKGGDLTDELKRYNRIAVVEELELYIPELPFFETKKIVYIPA